MTAPMAQELVLHDDELDEGCYRVRLLLSLLGLTARIVAVDVVPGGQQDSPGFRAISPAGVLPVLRIAGQDVCGAQAALLVLAYGRAGWWPDDGASFAQVAHWLDFAAGPLRAAIAARRAALFGDGGDVAGLCRAGVAALRIMEDHMARRRLDGATWFVGDAPGIVDVMLFPSFALSRDWVSHDRGAGHEFHPALRRWARAVRELPGFVTMPGIPDYN
ncbi:glutathione S-transferase family protein [Nguyenibacter vanlangensis]|uniref:Glutathione S-transferase family protein n=1 Tax=Nguyenibacter vanlangensis TaxID=1216886 RepID=A0ABZ3D4T7_9PROT